MTLPLFLNSDQVAEVIGMSSAAAFLRVRSRLEDDTLFPLPMPTMRRCLRWRRDEVEAWVARQGKPAGPDIDPGLIATGKVHLLDMARSA